MRQNKQQKISRTVILAMALLVGTSFDLKAQSTPTAYSQQQIDQMTAPIALYPDQLVAQVLMASTYPLEVVEASRWLKNPQNAQLQGDELASALMQQPWDPSVKSLVGFPQVLAMMNSQLPWTEQLGDAFLAQQTDVMNSVQRLRQEAQAAGNLASTPQETVTDKDDSIVIDSTDPQVIYVPNYNPTYVYGTWPYPDYEPYSFPSPNGYLYSGLIGFGAGIVILDGFWGWNHWDWHNHHIDIDNRRFESINGGRPSGGAGVWTHDPAHRHGVPYNSPVTRATFQGAANPARANFRGYAPQAQSPVEQRSNVQRANNFVRPTNNVQHEQTPTFVPQQRPQQVQREPQRPAPPAFESFSRGADVQVQSQRGAYSRSTMPAAPARSAPPVGGGGSRGGGNNTNERRR